MNTDTTDITLIVDRSGSMQSIKFDAQGGINALIEDQAKADGSTLLTIAQFDTEYELVCDGVNIDDAPPYELVPRGGTALLDAVGRTINAVGARLRAMNEADRPALVLLAIITDGQENSSEEFTRRQVAEMIKHQQEVYGWQFTFLCTDMEALTEAGSWGIEQHASVQYDRVRSAVAYEAVSNLVSRRREAVRSGSSGSDIGYTDEERSRMTSESSSSS